MYLKLKDDNTAIFYTAYNHKSMDNELIRFEINFRHCPNDKITHCFEADITNDLKTRQFMDKLDVDEDEYSSTKVQFKLYLNGDIGSCS